MTNGMYGLSTRATNGLIAAGVDLATEASARRGAAEVYGNGKFQRVNQIGKKSVLELAEWLERGGNGSPDDRRCPSCRFWDKGGVHGSDMGQCRRYAPRPNPNTDCLFWIETESTDWCGEWERKP